MFYLRERKFIVVLILMPLFFIGASIVFANQNERRLQEDKRVLLDAASSKTIYETPRVLMEYGGWLNYQFIDYNDYDNEASVADGLNYVHSADLRFWLKATLMPSVDADHDREHMLYLRFKDVYVERRGTDPGEAFDQDGPHLDSAYLRSQVDPFRLEVGRRYFNMGKGIAYSNVNDGVQLNFLQPGWNVGLLAAHTLPHQDNVDTSVPGYDKNADRYFYGLGVGLAKIKNHQLYSYFLVQRDESNQRPQAVNQSYQYNCEYSGLGMKGQINSAWNYWIEVIKETGTSRIFGSNEKKNIEAWALDAEMTVEPKWSMNPRFTFEYAFGSGDADRVSVTDTEFGNTRGDDENFLYFGYLSTGYALAPRLSNLHMVHCGLKVNPLEKRRKLRNLLVGLDYYRFYKHRKAGGISDSEATVSSEYIGSEMDLTFEWPLLSDLELNVEVGHFMPGDAYAGSANSNENFLLVSLIHTF
ncbi:alginate export family protein [Candidatus Omnitrophota bacterium]